MKMILLFIISLTTCNLGLEALTITDGSNFQWGFKESVRVPEKLCFTCTARLQLVSVVPSYCSSCFDIWEIGSEKCLHYVPRGTKLSYDQAPTYNIKLRCEDGATNPVGTVHLSVIPNFSPSFLTNTNSITLNVDVTKGYNDIIYTIPHIDTDDTILSFTLTESPNNGFFKINDQGQIIALKTLSKFCTPEDVRISLSDNHNPAVYLNIKFNLGTDSKPTLIDWNKSITVDENTLLSVSITDRLAKPGNCTLHSEPTNIIYDLNLNNCPAGSDQSSVIKTNSLKFNFEKDPPINITLNYDNGNCPSNTRWLNIYWNDVPEKPTLKVVTPEYSVNEGFITVKPDYVIQDEDQNERHTFSFATQNNDFSIHATTGEIRTDLYLAATDVSDLYKLTVLVTDKDQLQSDPVDLFISVSDINDHSPVLGNFGKNFQATECNPPVKFAIITATDDDFGKNKEIHFKALDSGSMLINNNGEVYLTKPPINGQVQTLTIQAIDKGEPPRESSKEVITLIGIPCPTTPPPPTTPAPPPPTTTTMPPPTTTESIGVLSAVAGVRLVCVSLAVTLIVARISR